MRLSAAITRSLDYLKGVLRLSPGNHNGSIRLHMGRLLACLCFVSWHAFVYAVRCWRWLGNELFIMCNSPCTPPRLFSPCLFWVLVKNPHASSIYRLENDILHGEKGQLSSKLCKHTLAHTKSHAFHENSSHCCDRLSSWDSSILINISRLAATQSYVNF